MFDLKQHKKVSLHGLAIASISLLTACGGTDESSEKAPVIIPDQANNCFWSDPYSINNPASNFAYPDTGATYWHARYTLPEGASLKLQGEFPQARYMSFNSYRADASPVHALRDQLIEADSGSINPYNQGTQRNSDNRDYQIQLVPGDSPETPAQNSLYTHAQAGEQATLLYRVYVPDNGLDAAGGNGLPTPELTLNDGQVLTGQAACDSLQSDKTMVSIPFVPEQTYAQLRQNNPAKENPIWRAAYNVQFNLRCAFLGMCTGEPERQVGWFANLDNQYLATYLDRTIKPVAVIRGKIPNIPATLDNVEVFDESQAQLRYWSMCQNEYYSQKVTACLYDEQVTINPDGYYTIVTSQEADRPSNAVSDCGIGYLPWSESGDGFSIIEGRSDNANDALLIMRHMLPADDFAQAIQNTTTPGDEAQVLGDYLPNIQYFTQAEFEALGCDAYTALPMQ